jgi:hypothetical protein
LSQAGFNPGVILPSRDVWPWQQQPLKPEKDVEIETMNK